MVAPLSSECISFFIPLRQCCHKSDGMATLPAMSVHMLGTAKGLLLQTDALSNGYPAFHAVDKCQV